MENLLSIRRRALVGLSKSAANVEACSSGLIQLPVALIQPCATRKVCDDEPGTSRAHYDGFGMLLMRKSMNVGAEPWNGAEASSMCFSSQDFKLIGQILSLMVWIFLRRCREV